METARTSFSIRLVFPRRYWREFPAHRLARQPLNIHLARRALHPCEIRWLILPQWIETLVNKGIQILSTMHWVAHWQINHVANMVLRLANYGRQDIAIIDHADYLAVWLPLLSPGLENSVSKC
jgi:hypothetical protein